jgi:hypothetical protein
MLALSEHRFAVGMGGAPGGIVLEQDRVRGGRDFLRGRVAVISVALVETGRSSRYECDMLHKRDLAGIVEVDGLKYEWELRREPQWCTVDGWKGMAVSLRQVGERREAVLEFPMPRRALNGSRQRQRPQVSAAIVVAGVRAALSAGWEPSSRGKPVLLVVDADGR